MKNGTAATIQTQEKELLRIRKLTILSLFSDDDLMDILVLKGGNALEIAYQMHSRASLDIDVSMRRDFEEEQLSIENVEDKLQTALYSTFFDEGYIAFDVKIIPKPRMRKEGQLPQWGGYNAIFRLIPSSDLYANDTKRARHRAQKIEIDISKYEYCEEYEEIVIDGYLIKVYSLKMIVFEKLRAICQQMNEYLQRTKKAPRSRDFYDIYVICESDHEHQINFRDPADREMLKNFFGVKEVHLHLLNNVKDTGDYHKQDFQTVIDTARIKDIKDFDFYFNYVVKKIEELETFWIE